MGENRKKTLKESLLFMNFILQLNPGYKAYKRQKDDKKTLMFHS